MMLGSPPESGRPVSRTASARSAVPVGWPCPTDPPHATEVLPQESLTLTLHRSPAQGNSWSSSRPVAALDSRVPSPLPPPELTSALSLRAQLH